MKPVDNITYTETLKNLLADYVDVTDDCIVSGITLDSREVKPGFGFFACRGDREHGHKYIPMAVENGAVVIIIESSGSQALARRQQGKCYQNTQIPIYFVNHLHEKIGVIAARFYQFPSQDMQVVAVTGTNGKTSCTHFLAQCLKQLQQPAGVVGTAGAGVWGALSKSSYTTLPATHLQRTLAHLRDQPVRHVFVEASSHGIVQGRLMGTQLAIAIFTNFSRDHLDYHGTVQAYANAKEQLFHFEGLQYAILNFDDSHIQQVSYSIPKRVKKTVFGLQQQPVPDQMQSVFAEIKYIGLEGSLLKIESSWGSGEITTQLLGQFNVSNLLAVLAALLHLDVPFDRALSCVEKLTSPVGRMERFGGDAKNPLVVVDYAHTPDALDQVLTTLRLHCTQCLWVVFGCGGDRDVGKRALMGEAAERLADYIILTDDNPRHENSNAIIAGIVAGFTHHENNASDGNKNDQVKIIRDRAMAIAYAIRHAQTTDLVLIAGKGHEDYQIIGDQRLHFCDRSFVKQLLKKVA